MYLLTGLAVAILIVTCARIFLGGEEAWSAETWAVWLVGSVALVYAALFVVGSAGRARTEREFAGGPRGPEPPAP
jgi:hypothetical protein